MLAKAVYFLATDSEFSASFRRNPELALAHRGLALDAADLSIVSSALRGWMAVDASDGDDKHGMPWRVAVDASDGDDKHGMPWRSAVDAYDAGDQVATSCRSTLEAI